MWEGSGVLPGGGATELALATHLLDSSSSSISNTTTIPHIRLIRESFAHALQDVVITLLKNVGSNVATVLAQLQAAHREGKRWGIVKLPESSLTLCCDPLTVPQQQQQQQQQQFGVAEVALHRATALRLATHTALNILRIDHFFTSSK
jgi:chaperonin GroEL (HSP60 family)